MEVQGPQKRGKIFSYNYTCTSRVAWFHGFALISGRGHPAGGAPAKGGSASRPHVPPGKNGPRGDGSSNQEQPQVTPFGQRFGRFLCYAL